MTPHDFGRLLKIAAETGGFGEFLGQGFDRGVQRLSAAVGLPTGISPQAWGGGGAQTVPTPAGAPKPSKYKDPSQMPGPSAAAPVPAAMAAPVRPPKAYKDPNTMPGPSAAAPAPAPAARPAPRPAAARPAPAQPRPTAPGVRRPTGRVA